VRHPAIHTDAEAAEVETAGRADEHHDPAVGRNADERAVAPAGQEDGRERTGERETLRHEHLPALEHLAARWRFP
jgi:hypothetical protein